MGRFGNQGALAEDQPPYEIQMLMVVLMGLMDL